MLVFSFITKAKGKAKTQAENQQLYKCNNFSTYYLLYCDGVSWSPIKPYSTWAIVVPLPGAWMYLASPRASPSWTSSTGQEYNRQLGGGPLYMSRTKE
jgi:hypothetical protein